MKQFLILKVTNNILKSENKKWILFNKLHQKDGRKVPNIFYSINAKGFKWI